MTSLGAWIHVSKKTTNPSAIDSILISWLLLFFLSVCFHYVSTYCIVHFNLINCFTGDRDDISVDTNAIDVSSAFVKYWNGLHLLIEGLTSLNKTVNVIVGPARSSSPSPSVFVVVSTCTDETVSLDECSVANLDFQSFLLPTNARHSRSCLNIDVFLRAHVATLRDIENLTNMKFFPRLTYSDKADLLSRTPLATMLLLNPDPSP